MSGGTEEYPDGASEDRRVACVEWGGTEEWELAKHVEDAVVFPVEWKRAGSKRQTGDRTS